MEKNWHNMLLHRIDTGHRTDFNEIFQAMSQETCLIFSDILVVEGLLLLVFPKIKGEDQALIIKEQNFDHKGAI